MFSITGTNLVDSIGTVGTGFNKLFKTPGCERWQFRTGRWFKTDSNITRPNTRVRLLRNNFRPANQLIVRQTPISASGHQLQQSRFPELYTPLRRNLRVPEKNREL